MTVSGLLDQRGDNSLFEHGRAGDDRSAVRCLLLVGSLDLLNGRSHNFDGIAEWGEVEPLAADPVVLESAVQWALVGPLVGPEQGENEGAPDL